MLDENVVKRMEGKTKGFELTKNVQGPSGKGQRRHESGTMSVSGRRPATRSDF